MSSRLQFGTIKRIVAILIAIVIVLAAGVLVGQAPAIFGVEEDPEADITFEDQESDGTSVMVDELSLSEGGFVVITDNGNHDDPLAVSTYLGAGSHEGVTVAVDEDADPELSGQLTATVHRDTTDNESFEYQETDGAEDHPYLEDGFPVSDTATVTIDDGDTELVDDSFRVESITAPATATTNETIEVTAEITNPTDLDAQQNVELRLDGAVLEQQVLDLDAEESQDVSFEIDTNGHAPGERSIGVYTDGDGDLAEIDLEFHTDPSVEIVGADDDGAVADVAIPEEGFVVVTDNETVVGTSEQLDPGEHSNVTVEFDETVTADEELTATLVPGDPDDEDVETAPPIEFEDDPIETTFTIADVDAPPADD